MPATETAYAISTFNFSAADYSFIRWTGRPMKAYRMLQRDPTPKKPAGDI
jgi:hypothetical protein